MSKLLPSHFLPTHTTHCPVKTDQGFGLQNTARNYVISENTSKYAGDIAQFGFESDNWDEESDVEDYEDDVDLDYIDAPVSEEGTLETSDVINDLNLKP